MTESDLPRCALFTANCDANPNFKPTASGGDGSDVQFWYVGFDPDLSVRTLSLFLLRCQVDSILRLSLSPIKEQIQQRCSCLIWLSQPTIADHPSESRS